jgi:hypothetical protein
MINPSNESVTYRISLTGKDQRTNRLIRFAPRQATLKAGKKQIVKLMVRKPAHLPEGEYYTRMQFMPLPDKTTARKNFSQTTNAPNIQINMIVGATIPILVRHGKLQAKVVTRSVSLEKSKKPSSHSVINVLLNRTGNRSVFLDLLLYGTGGPEGDEILLGQSRGFAIYADQFERTINVPINIPDGMDISNTGVKVVLRDRDETTHAVDLDSGPVIFKLH